METEKHEQTSTEDSHKESRLRSFFKRFLSKRFLIPSVLAIIILFIINILLTPPPEVFLPSNQNRIDYVQENQGNNQRYNQHSSLESSKQYLKTYGIDCTHENTNNTYNSLVVDPQNPNVIYIGIEGRGVYKSEDKGNSWKRKIKGIVVYPDSNDKSQLCFPDLSYIYIDPKNSQHLYLVAGDITTAFVDWPYGETGGVWESLDGAESWKQMIGKEMNVASSGILAIDPKNPKVMYYPVNPDLPTFQEAPIKESLMKKSSVYKTEDGGNTWREMDLPMLSNLQATRIFIDPKDSNHLLFFTQSHDHVYGENSITEVFLEKQHGIIESFDGGKNWISWEEKFPPPYGALFDGDISKNNFNHMIVRPFLFGSKFSPESTRQKSFYSVDGGKTFTQTSFYIWVGRYDPHDNEGNHLLGFASENSQIVESKDGGKTWERIDTPLEVSSSKVRISNFVWDPKDSNTVYMSGDWGNVWQSTNGGKNWKNILGLEKLPK